MERNTLEVKELERYLEALALEVLEQEKKLERSIEKLDEHVKKMRRSMENVDGALKELERNMETDDRVKEWEICMEILDGGIDEFEKMVKQLKARNKEISPNLNKETIADEIKNTPRLVDSNAFKKGEESGFNFSRVWYKQTTLLSLASQRGRELQVLIENDVNVEEVNAGDESEVLISFCKL